MFLVGGEFMGMGQFSQPGLRPLTPIESRVYEMCVKAAEEGRPLESIEEMTEAIGATGVSTVPGIMKRIEAKGWITRSVFQRGRQVCITASGKCTVPPRSQVPHWRLVFDRSKDSTPTLPRHKLVSTVPTLMTYLDRMMREDNLTLEQAQLTLMARGMQQREEARA